MIYVMSDLHGDYAKYVQMLKLINFSKGDTLFINGDICDRGEDSAKLYLDIMSRDNAHVIKGNHEVMAQAHLEELFEEYADSEINIFELYNKRNLWSWFENGGDMTVLSLIYEAKEDRLRILDFIKSLPYYRTVEVNSKRYVLVHGGLGDNENVARIEDVSKFDLVWSQPDFDGTYFDDANTILIVGHTPTLLLREKEEEATIYHGKGNVIAIDCGCAYPESLGRLGCLCLDTNEEFYV